MQVLGQLEKGLASTIHQLCSNHIPLNAYLHQIKQVDSPKYPHCHTPETISHYLLFCKQYRTHRKELRKYIISTAGFQHIRNYRPPNILPHETPPTTH
ncbi:hypothetical protein O181_019660 [Austropuccinia psidii MF-1]|uniref:Uncharacterized protein n=1 Tax=Austropuccinia psidii MF-1 TaxID=1389203 RepID=A0A9Q3CB46_9BASI|nr:hypothetical protein [Austropuccinia psidii MF-1]